ncbi:uncharacterized protein LOC118274294 isoform X1 [Spodoptera frugiperda]|uniref:Uncharacterized protein LOC118274294 isoform X1 n=1 Tax=Spodoptera frugiperda TaxID=7108 RepID=A0A9R0DC66_SPOFR|nr:uncharacterized protein LOC118274294 isoform X1 [Spodoptera frugiperda]
MEKDKASHATPTQRGNTKESDKKASSIGSRRVEKSLDSNTIQEIFDSDDSETEDHNNYDFEKNGQKRLTAYHNNEFTKKARVASVESDDLINDLEEYYLTITNFPKDWNFLQIKDYLDRMCGHIDEMQILRRKRRSKIFAVRLTFQCFEKCIEVLKKLDKAIVKGNVLKVRISESYMAYSVDCSGVNLVDDDSRFLKSKAAASAQWRPLDDFWGKDPEGLYGLKPEFLQCLNIKPPLSRIVHVTNFRCDKTELRDVMEMAGTVTMISVIYTNHKYAKVVFSHPLEAVQAISMLDGQLYYGLPLKIMIDRNPPDIIVKPKGLAGVGQGLGLRGTPLRNIAHEYQRFLNQQESAINPVVFANIKTKGKNEKEDSKEVVNDITEFFKMPPACNVINSTVPTVPMIVGIDDLECPEPNPEDKEKSKASGDTKGPDKQKSSTNRKDKSGSPGNSTPYFKSSPKKQNYSVADIMPNCMVNSFMFAPFDPFFGSAPNNRPPFFHARDCPFEPRIPFPMGPPPTHIIPPNFNGLPPKGKVTVKFSNLPPSTTFPLLCEQLAQCGQVMLVQLTTPGCAVATFGHPSQADRCISIFKGLNVMGYVIDVEYA